LYIITYTQTLENQKDYLVQIEPPPEMAGFFRKSGDSPLGNGAVLVDRPGAGKYRLTTSIREQMRVPAIAIT
jgi:hypothetical protein